MTYDQAVLLLEPQEMRNILLGMTVVASQPVFKAMADGLKDYEVADAVAEAVRAHILYVAKVAEKESADG